MRYVYTKRGRPLRQVGPDLFARSGQHVARLRSDRAFDPRGRYVGTLIGDRLVYRSTQDARIGSPFVPRLRTGFAKMNRVPSMTMGQEPPIPD